METHMALQKLTTTNVTTVSSCCLVIAILAAQTILKGLSNETQIGRKKHVMAGKSVLLIPGIKNLRVFRIYNKVQTCKRNVMLINFFRFWQGGKIYFCVIFTVDFWLILHSY
jgi:hypothetical protein